MKGPGEIVATDNDDPTDRELFSLADRTAFYGLALAIVKAEPGQSGEITLTATSQGLTRARTVIKTR